MIAITPPIVRNSEAGLSANIIIKLRHLLGNNIGPRPSTTNTNASAGNKISSIELTQAIQIDISYFMIRSKAKTQAIATVISHDFMRLQIVV